VVTAAAACGSGGGGGRGGGRGGGGGRGREAQAERVQASTASEPLGAMLGTGIATDIGTDIGTTASAPHGDDFGADVRGRGVTVGEALTVDGSAVAVAKYVGAPGVMENVFSAEARACVGGAGIE